MEFYKVMELYVSNERTSYIDFSSKLTWQHGASCLPNWPLHVFGPQYTWHLPAAVACPLQLAALWWWREGWGGQWLHAVTAVSQSAFRGFCPRLCCPLSEPKYFLLAEVTECNKYTAAKELKWSPNYCRGGIVSFLSFAMPPVKGDEWQHIEIVDDEAGKQPKVRCLHCSRVFVCDNFR